MNEENKIENDIRDIIANTLGCPVEDVLPQKHLCYDLLADSLALIDIMLSVEQYFNCKFTDKDISEVNNVRDLYDLVGEKKNPRR